MPGRDSLSNGPPTRLITESLASSTAPRRLTGRTGKQGPGEGYEETTYARVPLDEVHQVGPEPSPTRSACSPGRASWASCGRGVDGHPRDQVAVFLIDDNQAVAFPNRQGPRQPLDSNAPAICVPRDRWPGLDLHGHQRLGVLAVRPPPRTAPSGPVTGEQPIASRPCQGPAVIRPTLLTPMIVTS